MLLTRTAGRDLNFSLVIASASLTGAITQLCMASYHCAIHFRLYNSVIFGWRRWLAITSPWPSPVMPVIANHRQSLAMQAFLAFRCPS